MERFFYAGAAARDVFWRAAGEYRGCNDLRAVCRYACACARQRAEIDALCVYVTDALYALTRRDMRLTKRFEDVIRPAAAEDEMTAEEIIDHVRAMIKGGN